MSEASQASGNEDTGGVAPLRIPGAVLARTVWDGLPNLARVFVVLAGVDVVVRALGLFGTGLFLDLLNPLSWFTAFFPRELMILLPALLVVRRPDAIEATPVVMRGAIVIALVVLLQDPMRQLVSGNRLDPVSGPAFVSLLGILLTAGGWWWLAQGMRILNSLTPTARFEWLANLVGGAIALAALVNLGLLLSRQSPDVGQPIWNGLLQLDSAMLALQSLAFAYLARTAVLGTDAPTRPMAATRLATVALCLVASGSVLLLAVGEGAIWTLVGWITGPLATSAFLAAFGLGLADAWGTIDAAMPTEQPAPA